MATAKFANLRIGSFNMHGFDASVNYIKQLLVNLDILFIQEHWLMSDSLYKFECINSDFMFSGVSAMDNKCKEGILIGRPFGGSWSSVEEVLR